VCRVQRCKSVRIVWYGIRVGGRSRGHFVTPADFPLHDGSSYSHDVHVQRGRLGFVHRSRTIFILCLMLSLVLLDEGGARGSTCGFNRGTSEPPSHSSVTCLLRPHLPTISAASSTPTKPPPTTTTVAAAASCACASSYCRRRCSTDVAASMADLMGAA
jgi:hypothetical protein